MGRWFISLILFSSISTADDILARMNDRTFHSYSKSEMVNITQEAILKRDDVKLIMHNTDTWFWNGVTPYGITQPRLAPLGLVVNTLYTHRITTRGFYMHIEPIKNLVLRPDIDYYYKTGQITEALTITWRF